ncbi:MAG: MinD/ParA family protein [Nitrospirae bacterium]|nr:MinD/ParA family protein [Nitrospirota bacterium]
MVTQLDQASGLRAIAESIRKVEVNVQVIAVSSGKGGVGKTNVVANLAVASAQQGRRVMIMDADLALGNLDVLLGLNPSFTLEDVLQGHRELAEVIVNGPQGVKILPATSGAQDLTALTNDQQIRLQQGFVELANPPDLLLIDCAAGISSNVLYFSLVANETIVVVTPEPTSLTDAYALIKVLSTRYQQKRFRILTNMSKNAKEGRDVFRKLTKVTDRFLNISLDWAGLIPFDENLPLSVCQQKAVVEAFPKSASSRSFAEVSTRIDQWRDEQSMPGGLQLFGPSIFWSPLEGV